MSDGSGNGGKNATKTDQQLQKETEYDKIVKIKLKRREMRGLFTKHRRCSYAKGRY